MSKSVAYETRRASPWLTEAETAARLSMSKKWLQTARRVGGGPRFAKFGSSIRYSLADIEEYERQSLCRSTSDAGDRRAK